MKKLRPAKHIAAAITQQAELDRVTLKIGDVIIAFWRERLLAGLHDFRANELSEYVNKQIPNTTFDSCSRILRDLRQRGIIDYMIVSRRDSHYRLIGKAPVQQNLRLEVA